MALFRGKYVIESARLAEFDYSSPGEYFLTICTKKMVCHFGSIEAGRIRLSMIGVIAEEEWLRTARVRTNVTLDAFVVMPNHFHGIIAIRNSLVETTGSVVSHNGETSHRLVPTRIKTLNPNSLGSIVAQFKSVCTKRVHAEGFQNFSWQPGYYDHVIRNEKDLERIRDYIAMNPSRWGSDDEFARNIGMNSIHNAR